VRRLLAYHRNIAGIRSCYEHILKEINADQPKSDVFSQGMLLHYITLMQGWQMI